MGKFTFTPEEVASIIKQHYNLTASKVEEFSSYHDRVFHVTTCIDQLEYDFIFKVGLIKHWFQFLWKLSHDYSKTKYSVQ